MQLENFTLSLNFGELYVLLLEIESSVQKDDLALFEKIALGVLELWDVRDDNFDEVPVSFEIDELFVILRILPASAEWREITVTATLRKKVCETILRASRDQLTWEPFTQTIDYSEEHREDKLNRLEIWRTR